MPRWHSRQTTALRNLVLAGFEPAPADRCRQFLFLLFRRFRFGATDGAGAAELRGLLRQHPNRNSRVKSFAKEPLARTATLSDLCLLRSDIASLLLLAHGVPCRHHACHRRKRPRCLRRWAAARRDRQPNRQKYRRRHLLGLGSQREYPELAGCARLSRRRNRLLPSRDPASPTSSAASGGNRSL
jgi:hypothetical protein